MNAVLILVYIAALFDFFSNFPGLAASSLSASLVSLKVFLAFPSSSELFAPWSIDPV